MWDYAGIGHDEGHWRPAAVFVLIYCMNKSNCFIRVYTFSVDRHIGFY